MLKWGCQEDMADLLELRAVSEPEFASHLRGVAGFGLCAPVCSPRLSSLPSLRSLAPGDRNTQTPLVGRAVCEFVSIWT